MQRLKVGVGVLVFVGLVCAQAAAQDIPEKVRKIWRRTFTAPSWCSATRCRKT